MKKRIKIPIIVILVLVFLYGLFLTYQGMVHSGIKLKKGVETSNIWLDTDPYHIDDIQKITKTGGKDFKILVFSDIQLESNLTKDLAALKLMDQLVSETEPDLIMTTGDNTEWIFSDLNAKRLIKRFESYNIPWGVVLGNHDSEGVADRLWHGNRYEEAKNSIFKVGPSNVFGTGNYSVFITSESGEIIYNLMMLDSNERRMYDDRSIYDFIQANQINWYEWNIKSLNNMSKSNVPSMLFFHIPLPEFSDAGKMVKNDNNVKSFGKNLEHVAASEINSGLFNKVKELQSTSHIFVGHDHINTLSVDYQGVNLTYGLKTGRTSYSRPEMQGGMLITIKDKTNEVVVEHIYK